MQKKLKIDLPVQTPSATVFPTGQAVRKIGVTLKCSAFLIKSSGSNICNRTHVAIFVLEGLL